MANIKSINGNPIVLDDSGLSDGAVTEATLASGVAEDIHQSYDVIRLSPSVMPMRRGAAISASGSGYTYTANAKRAAYIIDSKRPVRLTCLLTDGTKNARWMVYRNVSETLQIRATLGDNSISRGYQNEVIIPDDGYAYAISAYYDNGNSNLTDEQFAVIANSIEMSPADVQWVTDKTIQLLHNQRVTLPVELGATDANNVYNSGTATTRARSGVIITPMDVTFRLSTPSTNPMVFSVYGTSGLVVSGKTEYTVAKGTTVRIVIQKSSGANIGTSDLADIALTIERANGGIGSDVDADRLLGIFEKLTVIGDSLACGYTSKGGTTHNSTAAKEAHRNWPTYLGLELGRDITNVAVGGSSAHDWRTTHMATADVDTDCYLIGMGVNDVRQSLTVGSSSDIKTDKANNSDTFYGNYDFIVRSCLDYNGDSQVFVFTIPATEGSAASYNTAIRAIAALYSRVHLIDLANIYPTNFTSGVLASQWDGHSTPLGYMIIASMLRNAIAMYMYENAGLFTASPWS